MQDVTAAVTNVTQPCRAALPSPKQTTALSTASLSVAQPAAPKAEVGTVQRALRGLLTCAEAEAAAVQDCGEGAGENMPMSAEMEATEVVGVSIALRAPTAGECAVLEAEAAARREAVSGETPAAALELVVQGSPAKLHSLTYRDWAEGELEQSDGEAWQADDSASSSSPSEASSSGSEAGAREELDELIMLQHDEDEASALEELEALVEGGAAEGAAEGADEQAEMEADVEAWAAATDGVEARLAALDAAVKSEDAAGLQQLEEEMEAQEHAEAFESLQEHRALAADVEAWASHDKGAATDLRLASIDAACKAHDAAALQELEVEMEVQDDLERGVEEWASADMIAVENKALGNIGRSLLGLLWMQDDLHTHNN